MGAGGPWPGACQGAVSLTFDDGMGSQLRLAVPALERNGLRATFYLNPRGDDWAARLAPWRQAAAAGHELGNHTVAHPCSRGFDFVPPGRGLEDLTLEDIAADLDLAEARLRQLAGPGPRSFAYPCYQDWVGSGRTRRTYVPLVAERFAAARARGERPNDAARCDLHYLWSFPVERMSGAELVGLCEQAALEGRWAILTLHGVHEGGLSVQEQDLAQLCAHLGRHRDRIWTAPVAEAAVAVGAWRAG
jgi:peptidoglycan/xylan/chitin deacetylase (PgdA/CDA1 family)